MAMLGSAVGEQNGKCGGAAQVGPLGDADSDGERATELVVQLVGCAPHEDAVGSALPDHEGEHYRPRGLIASTQVGNNSDLLSRE